VRASRYTRDMRSSRTRLALLVALVALCAFALVGCGSSSSSSSTQASSSAQTAASATTQTGTATTGQSHLATAKFLLHSGLAFGAFHRWIYKPYKAGNFTGGNLSKHKAAAAKAALAALFAYHEVKLAVEAGKSSPTVSKLLAPLTALQSKLQAVRSGLKSGTIDPAAITSANADIGNVSSAASAAGQSIKEQVPSAGQLLSGG
jgi:hypothetical protein